MRKSEDEPRSKIKELLVEIPHDTWQSKWNVGIPLELLEKYSGDRFARPFYEFFNPPATQGCDSEEACLPEQTASDVIVPPGSYRKVIVSPATIDKEEVSYPVKYYGPIVSKLDLLLAIRSDRNEGFFSHLDGWPTTIRVLPRKSPQMYGDLAKIDDIIDATIKCLKQEDLINVVIFSAAYNQHQFVDNAGFVLGALSDISYVSYHDFENFNREFGRLFLNKEERYIA